MKQVTVCFVKVKYTPEEEMLRENNSWTMHFKAARSRRKKGLILQQSADLVGQLVGHYRILQPLASGGMATVYQAEDVHLHRLVAMKVFRPELGETSTFLRHFAREAQVLANLDHPHILLVHDYGEQDGFAYLIMPLMMQGSLQDRLQSPWSFSVAEVLRLGEQILEALQYAHEHGLVHRDVKPANLLFKSDGTLLLSDFGLVKILPAANELDVPPLVSNAKALGTSSLAFRGTPAYMAPEQIQGQAIPQSDIYSVGVVLYELLTGSCPFRGERAVDILVQHLTHPPRPLRELNPDLPAQLEVAVMHALEKDPQHRYQSASEFLQVLRTTSHEMSLQSAESNGPEEDMHSPLASSLPTRVDLFKTQWMEDVPPAKEAQANTPPSAPRTRRKQRRWVPSQVVLPALLLLVLAGSSLGVLVYQNHTGHSSPGTTQRHGMTRPGTPSATAAGTSTPQGNGLTSASVPQTCPKDDAHANSAVMPSLPSQENHQNLVYLTMNSDKHGNALSAFQRYDISAHQSRNIVNLPPGGSIEDAQISGDGQWILFLAGYLDAATPPHFITKMQMVRLDGQDLQTLYCSTKPIRGILWFPDASTVVFNLLSPTGVNNQDTPLSMYGLDTRTGDLFPILNATAGTGYTPLIWVHQYEMPYTMFYATNYQFHEARGPLDTLPGNLYFFDLNHNPPYTPVLTSKTNGCQTYALSPDSTRLFISRCNPASGPQGPSSIQVEEMSNPQHPSSPRTILSQSTLAIFHIAAISNTTLLLDVLNGGTDSSQDGIWELNMDGTGLRRLTTSGVLTSSTFSQPVAGACQDPWTNVSHDGQFYSVLNWRGSLLAYGPLSGTESQVTPLALAAGGYGVLGWATL